MAVGRGYDWALGGGGVLLAGGYALLGIADMALSSVAFALGIPEANPLLAWALGRDLFVPTKLLLTGLVSGLLAWIYPRRHGKQIGWFAVVVMSAIVAYHVWGLRALFGAR